MSCETVTSRHQLIRAVPLRYHVLLTKCESSLCLNLHYVCIFSMCESSMSTCVTKRLPAVFLPPASQARGTPHNSSIIKLPLKFQASHNKELDIARSKMGNQQSSQGYPERVEGWYGFNTWRRDRENLPQSPYPPAKRISNSGRTPLRERNLEKVPNGQFSLERDEWARARLKNGRARR